MAASREQSPSWEAKRSSDTEEISRILWNPESSLPNSQEPNWSSQCPPPTNSPYRRSILILSSHLGLGVPGSFLPSVFPTESLYTPLLFSYVLHVLFISIFLIWSPQEYLVRITEHRAPRYVVFSTPLLPHPSWAQISSSAPYSRKPSVYIPRAV